MKRHAAKTKLSWIAVVAAVALAASACVNRPIEEPKPQGTGETGKVYPLSLEKDIDILFVLDNSNSMGLEQENLRKNFPKFIEALRAPSLNNKIPNVHLGVISTDLGAGNYSLPSCEVSNGDGGKLLAQPRQAGCVGPSKSYIEYIEGVTNINNPAVGDPIDKVKQAFQCIAEIGTGGCGFESTIEAARRALDPKLNRNPGFIRKDAFLAVVFITDEDDCSAQKPQLFDPNQNQINDPLGPLTSFRCFEFGVQCDCPGGACKRTSMGARKSCKPAHNWLYKVEDYKRFFEGLKPKGRLLMFAVAGPTDKVEVGMDNQNPSLRPSCQTSLGSAAPAIRIKALIDGIDKGENQGYFNEGTNHNYTQSLDVNICSPDYSPALRLLGRKIVAALGGQCLVAPPMTRNGGIACAKGDSLGQDDLGRPVTCQQGCLDKADCVVSLRSPTQGESAVPKCAPALFNNPANTDCGGSCPCWRIVPKPTDCKAAADGSPYGIEIVRKGEPEKGSSALVKCSAPSHPWGSANFAEMSQCN
jgi:hypothetical protein